MIIPDYPRPEHLRLPVDEINKTEEARRIIDRAQKFALDIHNREMREEFIESMRLVAGKKKERWLQVIQGGREAKEKK